MGAERAITAIQRGGGAVGVVLQHFNDEIVVKVELREGTWILMGRVIIENRDGDSQWTTAKLVHDANVVLDEVRAYTPGGAPSPLYLQAGLTGEGNQTVTLECNTYAGGALYGSVIAFNVDRIDVQ